MLTVAFGPTAMLRWSPVPPPLLGPTSTFPHTQSRRGLPSVWIFPVLHSLEKLCFYAGLSDLLEPSQIDMTVLVTSDLREAEPSFNQRSASRFLDPPILLELCTAATLDLAPPQPAIETPLNLSPPS